MPSMRKVFEQFCEIYDEGAFMAQRSGSLLCRLVKEKGHDEISETQVLTKKTRERIPPSWKRPPVEGNVQK